MTYELSKEEEEELYTKIMESEKRRKERRRGLSTARKAGAVPPPHTPHRFFLPNTTAHAILATLSKKGPTTRQELKEELKASEAGINTQILHLLDCELVDRDRHGVYSITDNGEVALAELDAGTSHTRWLR